ncbi:uncharacterized protein G2W53_025371 [Senna tora]|uniref:Uncharacterized protein n=1 Tax=Senna tora TaxID=362788 RepID=A0A834TF52_9FABA|nr:uncharacterized protein G2W53_025371 [Senna tora]
MDRRLPFFLSENTPWNTRCLAGDGHRRENRERDTSGSERGNGSIRQNPAAIGLRSIIEEIVLKHQKVLVLLLLESWIGTEEAMEHFAAVVVCNMLVLVQIHHNHNHNLQQQQWTEVDDAFEAHPHTVVAENAHKVFDEMPHWKKEDGGCREGKVLKPELVLGCCTSCNESLAGTPSRFTKQSAAAAESDTPLDRIIELFRASTNQVSDLASSRSEPIETALSGLEKNRKSLNLEGRGGETAIKRSCSSIMFSKSSLVDKGGVAVDDNDAGVAADIRESLVMRTRHDVTAVTAHQAKLGSGYRRKGFICPVFNNARGARRGFR